MAVDMKSGGNIAVDKANVIVNGVEGGAPGAGFMPTGGAMGGFGSLISTVLGVGSMFTGLGSIGKMFGGLFGGGGGASAVGGAAKVGFGAGKGIFGFSEGGILPMDRPSLVHRGEVLIPTPRMPTMALPASLVQGVLSAAGGAGATSSGDTYQITIHGAGNMDVSELAQQIAWHAKTQRANQRPGKRQ